MRGQFHTLEAQRSIRQICAIADLTDEQVVAIAESAFERKTLGTHVTPFLHELHMALAAGMSVATFERAWDIEVLTGVSVRQQIEVFNAWGIRPT